MRRNKQFKDNGPSADNKEDENSNCSVSFEYMISNKRYNYNHFNNKTNTDSYKALKEFVTFVEKVCKVKHCDLGSIGVIENEPLNKLRRGNGNLYSLFRNCNIIPRPDTKVIIMRFGDGGKYRVVLKWDTIRRSVIHILALDFDYSLYDHGN